jgi:hypothetical protein
MNIMSYDGPNSYTRIAASATIKTGRGTLHRLIVNWGDDDTPTAVIAYDNTAASGTQIVSLKLDANETGGQKFHAASFEVGARFGTGLYVTVPAHVDSITAIFS